MTSLVLLATLGGGKWHAAAASPQLPTGSVPAAQSTAGSPVAVATAGDGPDAATPLPTVTPSRQILPDMVALLSQNPDLAGWLKIDGTPIDYPVLYRHQDEGYYLDHNFEGKRDANGALFIQPACDPFGPSTNLIVYGHNMKSGKMFGSLDAYRKKEFWQTHPTIRFDTLVEHGTYDVLAVFLSRVYNENDIVFKYYQFRQANTPAELDDFLKNIRKLALYDTGVEAHFGDTFLTLSTCSYETENGRLVVVARKKANKTGN